MSSCKWYKFYSCYILNGLNMDIFFIANTIETKDDEFWDYDKQIDLEAFNSRTLYDTLSKQSRSVTNTIGKHKDEV